MEAVLNPGFSIGYERTKEDVYEELNSRINTVILNSMKEYLRKKGVEFDGSSIDLKEFKSKVVPTLDKQSRIDIANIEQGLNEQLTNLTNSLREGSTTAFQKFTNKLGNFSKSTVETAARLTAVKTAFALSPTAGGVALGTSILAPKVVKATKDIKKNMEDNTKAALDVLLLKLGTTVVDEKPKYDVSEEIRKIVASNLKSEGIEISTSDTIHFLQDISNLDNSQKEKAINMLNNLKGNPFDVKKEIEKTKISLKKIKKIIGDDVVAPLSTAALFGLSVGNTLIETMPDLAPSIITALSVGALTGDLGIGAVSGGGQYLLSKFGSYIPFVGNIIDDVTSTIGAQETILATTGAAAIGTLGLKILPKLVYKGVKGTFEKIKTIKEGKSGKKALDEVVATTDVQNRIQKAQKEAENELNGRENKNILLDVITDILRSEGIEIPNQIRTKEELEVFVSKLSNEEKKEVYKIVNILEGILNDNTKNLKKTLINVAKTAYWGGIIALAGLGAYDAFINPGFIEGLKERDDVLKDLREANGSDELSKEELKKLQEEKIQEYQEEIKEQIEEQVDKVKEILPDEIQTDGLMIAPGFWTAKNCVGNRVIISGLNLDTEEGLLEFLQNFDSSDERLQELLDIANVSTVEELASSDFMKYVINQVGNDTYYLTGYGDSGIIDYYKFIFFDKGKMETNFIELVNDMFSKKLADLPIKTSSNEDIINFAESLVEDSEKSELLAIYLETIEQKNGDYILENLKDIGEKLGIVSEDITTAKDAINKYKELQSQMEEYDKELEKIEGIGEAMKTDISSNPGEIFAQGMAAGGAVGIAGEGIKGAKKLYNEKKNSQDNNENKNLEKAEQDDERE